MFNRNFLVILVFVLAGCDYINSEFSVPSYTEPPFQKPTCHFKAGSNCWTKSVNALLSCMDVEQVKEGGVLTDDKELCLSDSGKVVSFKTPLELFAANQNPKGVEMKFKVYSGSRSCFQFTGDANEFRFDTSSGTLSVETNKMGDRVVRCLDGTSFIVPKQATKDGCAGTDMQKSQYLPGIELSPMNEARSVGWFFMFMGLGAMPVELFKCYAD